MIRAANLPGLRDTYHANAGLVRLCQPAIARLLMQKDVRIVIMLSRPALTLSEGSESPSSACLEEGVAGAEDTGV